MNPAPSASPCVHALNSWLLPWSPPDLLVQVPLHISPAFQWINNPPRAGGSQRHRPRFSRCIRINAQMSPPDGNAEYLLNFVFIFPWSIIYGLCKCAISFFLFFSFSSFLFLSISTSGGILVALFDPRLSKPGSFFPAPLSDSHSELQSRKPFSPLFCTQPKDSNFIWRYF